MIPHDYITAWRERAPWVQDAQVEQDLVISRALVEILSYALDELLGTKLRALYQRKQGHDPQFRADIGPLLSAGFKWNVDQAAQLVGSRLIERLPGDPWRGKG